MRIVGRIIGFTLFCLATITALYGQTAAVQNPGSVIVNGHALTGVVTMPAAGATPDFDAAHGICFVTTLTAPVTSSTISNVIPGQMYVFEIIEGATPYAFVWPKTFYGASNVPAQANRIVINLAVGLSDGSLLQVTSVAADINAP